MTVRVLELDLPTAKQWCAELACNAPVSLSPDFAAVDSHRQLGLTPHHVGIELDGQRWLYSVHCTAFAAGNAIGVISPYGYGGPLVALEDTPQSEWLARVWQAWSNWCRSRRWLAELARLHPMLPQANWHGGIVTANRDTVMIPLDEELLVDAGFNSLARRKCRRAMAAGASIRWSSGLSDWQCFSRFYREAMQTMCAAPKYMFSEQYFLALSQLEGARLCIVSGPLGEMDTWWSAGIYLFGATVAEYHLGASTAVGFDHGSPYLMQKAAAEEAKRRHCHSLYLGGGTDTLEENPLLFHKSCFSTHRRTFHVATAIHDAAAYSVLRAERSHNSGSTPLPVLFDLFEENG